MNSFIEQLLNSEDKLVPPAILENISYVRGGRRYHRERYNDKCCRYPSVLPAIPNSASTKLVKNATSFPQTSNARVVGFLQSDGHPST